MYWYPAPMTCGKPSTPMVPMIRPAKAVEGIESKPASLSIVGSVTIHAENTETSPR
jgi:hypothetical protein